MEQGYLQWSQDPSSTAHPILLVTDASAGLDELPVALHDAGFEVVTAQTCCGALLKLSSRRFNAIVCAERLRDGCWKDLLSYTLTEYDGPPVVVVFDQFEALLCAEALALGAYDAVTKPVLAEELLRVLTAACTRPDAAASKGTLYTQSRR